MRTRSPVSALLLLAAVGCQRDPAGPQPLLSLHGSAELERGVDAEGLQAAIVFVAGGKNALHIIDPESEADFPDRFQLALWEEPPEDTAGTFVEPDGETFPLAIGYIAAVTADHPEYAPQIDRRDETLRYTCDREDPEDCTCPEEGCIKTQRLCVHEQGEERCVVQTWICPQVESATELCRDGGHEGDLEIARAPWVSVQGVSQNYLLLYASRTIPKESYLASLLELDSDLPAGYHLLHVRLKTDRELADASACQRRAELRAVEDYNRDNDANYDATQLKTSPCLSPSCPRDVFAQYLKQAVFERGCPVGDRILTPLSARPEDPIFVELKRELWSPLAPSD